MTGKTETNLERLFFWGRPLSPLYGLLMAARSNLYRTGIFRRHRLDVPVISVGNLLMGGTGKTPLVHYIARLLQQQNKKPAILSRGYKGSAAAPINLVANDSTILLEAAEAGDEPRLLAEKLPGIPVITGKNRVITGRFAIDSLGADTLILDDGFQHLALQRDLDLVLFSSRKLLGNGRVLPGGELREPVSALKRADAFIIMDIDHARERKIHEFIQQLRTQYPEKPVFSGIYEPEKMLPRMYNGKNDFISHAEAATIPLYGFCGIAGPESFKRTLELSGVKLTGFQAFADHQDYSETKIESLLQKAKNAGAAGLITTEKDLVKLRRLPPVDLPLLALPVQLRFTKDFDRFLTDRLADIPEV